MAWPWNRDHYSNPDQRFVGRIDRRLFTNFDWFLLLLVVGLCLIGLVNLYSATHSSEHLERFRLQLVWLVVGFMLLSLSFAINYQYFENNGYTILVGVMVLLAATLVIGYVSHGARRWLNIGPVRFQPSELAKIAVVIALAKYLAGNPSERGYNLKELGPPLAIVAGPMALVAMQPDLGTAIMLLLIAATMLLFAGVRWRTVLGLGFSGAALSVFSFLFLLKPFQRNRILTLINPDADPLGAGYHIRQSLIAIGSGRLWGKGWLHGTQAKLEFLPEAHTDFAFSVFSEEWGFAGGLLVLGLYFALVAWSLNIAMRSKDLFGSMMAVGFAALLFWHIFINVGMVLGLLPVVGMPLPFLSYGRTSLLAMMIAVGFLLNISSRRYIF
jgi:rod shape determining protein RodA